MEGRRVFSGDPDINCCQQDDNRPIRRDAYDCESIDLVRFKDVLYCFSGGFLFLQAREQEHVPV